MKNIHVLPTDKSSRLSIKDSVLILHRLQYRKDTQHIYITSDEEIKEGDWYFDGTDLVHKKTKYNDDLVDGNKDAKKIILTTDQDLIKDGVQAIPDDFLEWFVKNPSCERVEIETIEKMIGSFDGNGKKPIYVNEYKIIIPKEEPISFPFFDKEKADDITKEGQKVIRELQSTTQEETLEEAAERIINETFQETFLKHPKGGRLTNETIIEVLQIFFKLGVKWQAERMYSEEDLDAFRKFMIQEQNFSKSCLDIFVKQFKKK